MFGEKNENLSSGARGSSHNILSYHVVVVVKAKTVKKCTKM